MSSKLKDFKKIIDQWGGALTIFFTYAHGSHDMSTSLLVPLLPLIRESFQLSYLQSGLLISAYTITSGFSQIPMGWLGDRTNYRLVLTMGLLGVGIATITIGLSPAYYPMLIILVILGVFAGGYHPSSNTLLAGYYGPEHRGSVLGLHGLGGITGLTLSPVLGGLLANALGWRYAYIILGIPAIIAGVLVWQKLKLPVQTHDVSVSDQSPSGDTSLQPAESGFSRLVTALRSIAVITVMAVLTQLIAGIASSYIPLYLVDKHDIAAALAAMWLGVVRGGGMVGSLLGGWLSDRWGRKNVIILVIAGTGPILYFLSILPFNAVLIVMFVFFGLLMQMRQPAIQTLLMDTTPPQFRATVIGFYFFLSMEGMSLAQPIAGYFMDVFGIVEVFRVISFISIGLSVLTLLISRKI